MLPSPTTSLIGFEDTSWPAGSDVESLSFHPDVEETRYPMSTTTNDASVEDISELNASLEQWFETRGPEQAAMFLQQMEELNFDYSSHDIGLDSRNLAYNNTAGHQLLDAPICTRLSDIRPSSCQVNAAQNSEQFLQSGQIFVKSDPDLDLNNLNSSFSDSHILQPVSPTHVAEEMLMYASDDYVQSNLQCQDALAVQRLHAFSIEQISSTPGIGHVNNPQRSTNSKGSWRTGSNLYEPGRNLLGPVSSYEGEFGEVDVGVDRLGSMEEDRSQTEEDDDWQSNSPGSVRTGGRRFSTAEKRERRKEQNRRAATKCRNRKKAEFETFKEECQRVKMENTTLRHQREKLRLLVSQLTAKLQSHAKTCSFANKY